MPTAAEAFETAFAHHQAGRIAEAVALYQQVLKSEPAHVDALHLLGVAAHQSGRHEVAVQCIRRAITLRGGDPALHANLGEVYRSLGKFDQAGQCYRQALRLNPDSPDTRVCLAAMHQQQGELDQAAEQFEEALRLRPDFPEAHVRLGVLLRLRGDVAGAIGRFQKALQINAKHPRAIEQLGATLAAEGRLAEAIEVYQQALRHNVQSSQIHVGEGASHQGLGRLDEAAASYREALRLDPRFALAHNNLGTVLKEQGRFDEALACYQSAISADPNFAEPHYNLGIVRATQGRAAEAMETYGAALRLQPNYVKALVNYGGLAERFGRLDEALECFQRVTRLEPGLPIGHFLCGNVYRGRRMLSDAIAAYQEAIRLQPDYADVYNNLAVVYADMGDPDASEKCCRKGLEYAPQLSALYSNLAIALLAQGRLDEALAVRRRAIELEPNDPGEHSNLVYDLNFVPGLTPEAIFAEHLQWAKRHAEPLTALARPHANARDPERRIRVGYVSAFFRSHAVNFFTEPILTAHEHERFEILCYSDVVQQDAATARIKAAVDGWRDTCGLTTEELAERVRADGIDILVDLTGHIGTNRLPTFARKPAPIQVTYLGYQNTTGMSAMDYRLTDERADPPGVTDRFYTEKLVRLPRAFFCYRPPDDAPLISPSPAIEQGYVTFGSFNKFTKVTPGVIEAWLRILARVPTSRLLVLANTGGFVENRLRVAAAARGIDPARVEVCNKQPHAGYMKLLTRADVGLDPFPFTGHTTTCDLAWTGVPVVMLEGQTYVTRFGGSVLASVGLESWIAGSVDEYVEIAVRAAQDVEGLARLRGELRARMAASPLMDFVGFTRNLEDAYRQMWRTWCAAGQ